MEFSRINETIIENEYCDIFLNQVFMEISLTKTMEGNRSLQTQSSTIQNEEEKTKENLQKLRLQEKNGEGMIGMHCVDHFSL
jgi:hypothetical protein